MAAVILGLFAIAGTSLVVFTHATTKSRIAANERETLLRTLHALVPPESVDNDMVTDILEVSNPEQLGGAVTTVYRGRLQGDPVATVLTSVVPNGYSGPINLLVGILAAPQDSLFCVGDEDQCIYAWRRATIGPPRLPSRSPPPAAVRFRAEILI